MVPYIAALIILIVAVLFAVYKRVDTFEVATGQDFRDLYRALCNQNKVDASGNPVPTPSTDASGNNTSDDSTDTETTDGKAPSMTAQFSKEVENRIAKSVATQLKDTLLAQRSTDHSIQDTSCPYASYQSDSTAQGQEYVQGIRSPQPDMSEYIRKDSIPCWNCSLP